MPTAAHTFVDFPPDLRLWRTVPGMDSRMSTQCHATQAVNLLRRVGYQDAAHAGRRTEVCGHIIKVSTDHTGDAGEVLRIVTRIDPDAHQLD